MTPAKIKKLRERSGLTQRQFARVLGVTHQTVINWERGRTSPQKAQLAIMERLRKRLDEAKQEEKRKKLVASLLTAAGLAGLSSVLDQLFGDDE